MVLAGMGDFIILDTFSKLFLSSVGMKSVTQFTPVAFSVDRAKVFNPKSFRNLTFQSKSRKSTRQSADFRLDEAR